LFDLGEVYALAGVDLTAQASSSACGGPGGAQVLSHVYAQAADDAGYELVGPVPGAGGHVALSRRVLRLAVCLPPDPHYSALHVQAARLSPAQACDSEAPGS
jgi:hypothetical protein